MNIRYLDIGDHRSGSSPDTKQCVEPRPCYDDRQLELDLGDRSCRLLKIAITESIHGLTLKALIDELNPEFVLDLREVLRFDMPGLSRDHFFHMLSVRGVHYARAPIGWHHISPRALTANSALPQRLHHEAVERWGGNLVLLVSRPEHALHTQAMLNLALSSKREEGWRIERIA